MISAQNRRPLCANAALRVRIMLVDFYPHWTKSRLASIARSFERGVELSQSPLLSFFAINIAPFAAMLDRLLRLEELRSASALRHAAEHA
jgi:hypothetical protein